MSDYERQLVHIQALIIDMFAIIRDYNPYATFFTVIAGIVWYIFSFICCRWLFISGSNESHETHKLECYVIQFLTTSLILLILGSFARVKIVCGHLRQFITTMISFDRSSSFRKRRWHIILNFYTPVPLYCFNVSRTSELSWLLGCKWTGWLFSVLLIVSNFFDYLKKP